MRNRQRTYLVVHRKVTLLLNRLPVFSELKASDYSDLSNVINFVKKYYSEKVIEINRQVAELQNSVISKKELEQAIKDDTELTHIQESIDTELDKYNKASIFTKVAHKFKLNALKTKYEERKQLSN